MDKGIIRKITMNPYKNVPDLIIELGGITTVAEAREVFARRSDEINRKKFKAITDLSILLTVANTIHLCRPEHVFINTGSQEDVQFIRDLALEGGEEFPLPMPGHTYHFDLKEEQGRIVDRTFYIAEEGFEDEISSLALFKPRNEVKKELAADLPGIMEGKTMLVGFYSRGPLGSQASDPAIEITSSAYVMHSAELLYRNIYKDFNNAVLERGYFYTNIHSQGDNTPEELKNARVFIDRAHMATYSYRCTYAGNTLMMKKGNHRLSIDRAVYKEYGAQLAEHMFITGVTGPKNRKTWIIGAAPSGCGKTTTAMAGNYFVGDDLAQIWIDNEGAVRTINPESGIFGIVEDVNYEGDPMLMDLLRHPKTEVIWSNVLIDENQIPQWTGNGEKTPPTKGFNFQGEWWAGKTDENGNAVPMSHPNARCTLGYKLLANYDTAAEDPVGVPVSIITYSGRDTDTNPPLRVAKNYEEGIVIGACIVSAATATEVGATGVKRQPWANASFIAGPLSDYMKSQYAFFGNPNIDLKKKPVFVGLNYFLNEASRGGATTKLLGEKCDVKAWMAWMDYYVNGEVEVIDSPIGYLPKYEDLKILFKEVINKEYPKELYDRQFAIYADKHIERLKLQESAFGKEIGEIPGVFMEILRRQRAELEALKAKFGSIISIDDLA